MEKDCLVPLTVEYLDAITRIHAGAFPGRALSTLGEKFILRYYRILLTSGKFRYAVGAVENGQLLGYLIGGEMKGVMVSFLKRNFAFLLLHIITHPSLLFQPIVQDRLRQGLEMLGIGRRHPRRKGPNLRRRPRSFTVLVIAVDPEIQNRGVGRFLMEEAEAAAIANDYEQMHLSVDVDNTGATRFYERLGYHKDFHKTWRGSMLKPIGIGEMYALQGEALRSKAAPINMG